MDAIMQRATVRGCAREVDRTVRASSGFPLSRPKHTGRDVRRPDSCLEQRDGASGLRAAPAAAPSCRPYFVNPPTRRSVARRSLYSENDQQAPDGGLYMSFDENQKTFDEGVRDMWEEDAAAQPADDHVAEEWWEEEGKNLSEPSRGVARWLPGANKEESKDRPWWAWWQLGPGDVEDHSLNKGLVSVGSTITRLYTQEEWTRHRNPYRYLRYLYYLLKGQSVVLTRCAVNLLLIAVWATALCCWNACMGPAYSIHVEPAVLTYMGAFVSLLLVFRTNSAYGRFVEARTLLGQLVLHARELARLAVTHFPRHGQRRRAVQLAAVFAWCLKARVRARDNPEPNVRRILGRRHAHALLATTKPAFFALKELSSLIKECDADIPPYAAHAMEQHLFALDRVLGGCERLLTTPIPLSYTRHGSRSLFLYLLAVPMGLTATHGWVTVPLTVLISFIVLGVDETGVHIEEPFCVLPLQQLCQVVAATCQETLQLYSNAANDPAPTGRPPAHSEAMGWDSGEAGF